MILHYPNNDQIIHIRLKIIPLVTKFYNYHKKNAKKGTTLIIFRDLSSPSTFNTK